MMTNSNESESKRVPLDPNDLGLAHSFLEHYRQCVARNTVWKQSFNGTWYHVEFDKRERKKMLAKIERLPGVDPVLMYSYVKEIEDKEERELEKAAKLLENLRDTMSEAELRALLEEVENDDND